MCLLLLLLLLVEEDDEEVYMVVVEGLGMPVSVVSVESVDEGCVMIVGGVAAAGAGAGSP